MTETSLSARVVRAWLVVAMLAAPAFVVASTVAPGALAQDDAGEGDGTEDEGTEDEAPPAETPPAEDAPADETAPTEAAPTETAPTEAAPTEAAPTETAPDEAASAGDETPSPESEGAESDGAGLADPSSESAESSEAEGEEEAEAPAATEEEAEEVQAEREPLAWRNSFFTWTHGISPNTFIRDAQLSYNPFYYWSFSLSPRWYLDPRTFFFVNQGLSYELTDSDGGSAYNHDLQLSDTIVDLRHTIAWEGFIFIPAGRVQLPASKLSQAAQRYFMLGGTMTAVRVIPEAWALTVGVTASNRYWFAGSATPQTLSSYPGTTADPEIYQSVGGAGGRLVGPDGEPLEPTTISQASATPSIRHTILAALTLNVTPASGLNVSIAGFWLSQEGYGLGGWCVPVDGAAGGVACEEGDTSPTRWRHAYYLSASVAYDILPWFNLSVGWGSATVVTPLFNQDGSVRSPFNPDNNFFLSTTFQLDGIYEAIVGGEDDGLTPEQRQRRRQGLAGVRRSGGSL